MNVICFDLSENPMTVVGERKPKGKVDFINANFCFVYSLLNYIIDNNLQGVNPAWTSSCFCFYTCASSFNIWILIFLNFSLQNCTNSQMDLSLDSELATTEHQDCCFEDIPVFISGVHMLENESSSVAAYCRASCKEASLQKSQRHQYSTKQHSKSVYMMIKKCNCSFIRSKRLLVYFRISHMPWSKRWPRYHVAPPITFWRF